MANTDSTSVTELILAKIIESLLYAYQFDEVTALPFFRFKSLIGGDSPVASFPRKVKDAHTDIANEDTSLTAVEFETTAVDVTCARVGIARELTTTAMEDNIHKRALFTRDLVMDAAILLGEAADEDALALLASAGSNVSNTGVDMTIANLVTGMATQRKNKARGPQVIHLHDGLLQHLQAAQAAATATPWAVFYQPNPDHTSFGGYFMGAPVFASSLNPSANSAADRVGAIWSQGQSAPDYCAFAYAVARLPTTKFDEEILADSEVAATTTRYGVGVGASNFATKLVFDNEA